MLEGPVCREMAPKGRAIGFSWIAANLWFEVDWIRFSEFYRMLGISL